MNPENKNPEQSHIRSREAVEAMNRNEQAKADRARLVERLGAGEGSYEAFSPDKGRQVNVRRTNGEVEGGWFITGQGEMGGQEFYSVVSEDEQGRPLSKIVPKGELDALNAGSDSAPVPPSTHEIASEEGRSPEMIEIPDWGKRAELGHEALAGSGVVEPAPELSQRDKILDAMPVLRMFKTDIERIAAVRKREDGEGYRQGMSQYDSSERMIDDLVARMNRVEKPKTLSEDRRGAIYRYIDM